MNTFVIALCAVLATSNAGLINQGLVNPGLINSGLLGSRTIGSTLIAGLESEPLTLTSGLGSPIITGRSLALASPLSSGLISSPIITKSLIDNAGLAVRSETAPILTSAPILAQRTIAAPVLTGKSLIDNAGLAVRSEISPILTSAPILAQRTIAAPVLTGQSLIDNAGLVVRSETGPILAGTISGQILAGGSLINNGLTSAQIIDARSLIASPLALNGLSLSNGLARSAVLNGVARADLIQNW